MTLPQFFSGMSYLTFYRGLKPHLISSGKKKKKERKAERHTKEKEPQVSHTRFLQSKEWRWKSPTAAFFHLASKEIPGKKYSKRTLHPTCSGRTQEAKSPVADSGQMVLASPEERKLCLLFLVLEFRASFTKHTGTHKTNEVGNLAESSQFLKHVPPEFQKATCVNLKSPSKVGGTHFVIRQTQN